MKHANPAARPETLLEHGPFVRRIARSLLFDEHRVDDVVQETWLAALERPPRKALRGWLGTVVRNFSLRSLRGEGRRARRELAAARPEAVPSTEEIVAQEAARRSVVEAVLSLEEPFRSAILLRYYEGLPPRSIARRLGIPVETARSRVKRGIELLRARLDGEHRGGRRAWCLAVAPLALARSGEAAGLLALGSIAMKVSLKIGIAATLIAGGFLALRPDNPSGTRDDRLAARPPAAPAAVPSLQGSQEAPLGEPGSEPEPTVRRIPQSAGIVEPSQPAPVATAPAPPVGVVLGTVTDPTGLPVEEASVRLLIPDRKVRPDGTEVFFTTGDTTSLTATTDSKGHYRFEVRKGGLLNLQVEKKGFEIRHASRRAFDPPYEERIDIALSAERFAGIRGRLLDLSGGPLLAEEIRFLFPPRGLDPAEPRPPQGASGIWALSWRPVSAPDPERFEEGRARIDPERATFEIDAPADSGRQGWGWLVTAYFRRDPVAEKPWKEGDPDVEFRLDPEALRGSLGNLEVRGIDASTRGAVSWKSLRLRKAGSPYGFGRLGPSGEGSAKAEGVRAGLYEVDGIAEGYAPAGASLEIRGGETTRVEIPLRPAAAARLRLVPVEGWKPEAKWNDFSFYDPGGRPLACRRETETAGGEAFVRILDAPPGDCWVVFEGNALRLDLPGGENRDRDFPIRRPRLLKVRFRPDASAIGPGIVFVFAQRLLLEGLVPVHATAVHTGAGEGGWAEYSFEAAPPGRYILELTPPGRATVRREVTIGEGDVTEVAVDGR